MGWTRTLFVGAARIHLLVVHVKRIAGGTTGALDSRAIYGLRCEYCYRARAGVGHLHWSVRAALLHFCLFCVSLLTLCVLFHQWMRCFLFGNSVLFPKLRRNDNNPGKKLNSNRQKHIYT